jgi:hydrogen peroxide-dependent heme synthase
MKTKARSDESGATPPETLEGWYALHQIFSVDRAVLADLALARTAGSALPAASHHGGWTALVSLIGSKADIMVVHFRTTLDEIGEAQRAFARLPETRALRPEYSFLSVTEAGLYHLTAELARKAGERGGTVGDETYARELETRVEAERSSERVQKRLYPVIPDGMPYVCFYPMSKRRAEGQNWYTLSLDERSNLMRAHGTTGRRYAGKVLQIITGAIGFDAWEWGVTLFAKDPLDFKRLVTDMRFDEVSAKYADFGDFHVGTLVPDGNLGKLLETIAG